MTNEEATAVICCMASSVLGMLPESQRLDVARAAARSLFQLASDEAERENREARSSLPVARAEVLVRRHPKDDR